MIALSTQDINLSFGTDVILKDISFAINDGDKLGIIGVNGAGKTSLFRILTGEYTPDSGAVYVQKGHTVGILEQNPDLSSLPGETTCLEYMYTAFPTLLALEKEIERCESELAGSSGDATISLSNALNELNTKFAREGGLEFRSRCRGMLLRLGFDEALIEQKIKTLSGGQYTRLALARLLATEPDILMLDEPTNHLDASSREELENTLLDYSGTMLIISHDRYFINKLAHRVLVLQKDGIKEYLGNYDYYSERVKAEGEQQKEEAAAKSADKPKNEYFLNKQRQSEERKRRTKLRKAEEEIERLDSEIEKTQAMLSDPETASDYEKLIELTNKLEELQKEQEKQYEIWEELSE